MGDEMEIQRAKEIIAALADGVNPLTGEILPSSDSCNQADVVRALHAVLEELDKTSDRQMKARPENAGNPWSVDEDAQLLYAYRNGQRVFEIAKIHQRSTGAIKARLVKLGEIRERKEAK